MSRSYRIHVRIERAEGLRAADSNGKSDPYISYGRVGAPTSVFHKTKVIEKTLDPVWNEGTTWSFEPHDADWGIAFDIYDKDVIGKDFLGHAEIDLKKELLKDKKLERDIVLELGPGPKTSEKTAKKITGKLHLHVTSTTMLLLDDDIRTKLENQHELSFDTINGLVPIFHEVSGGANTISEKEKIALLASHQHIYKFIVTLSVNDDVSYAKSAKSAFMYTDEVIREIVAEPALVDYWSRVMLIITGSKKEGVITLSSYLEGCALVINARDIYEKHVSTPKRDAVIFDLIDMDGDGAISYNDLMAFHAFIPFAVQHKMEAEFLKDPKVATMKQKIGKVQYGQVMKEMFNKFNFASTLRMMVISLTVRATEESINSADIKYTPEQFMKYFVDEKKRKDVQVSAGRDLATMIKDHSRDAQIVLQKALQKHGCN